MATGQITCPSPAQLVQTARNDGLGGGWLREVINDLDMETALDLLRGRLDMDRRGRVVKPVPAGAVVFECSDRSGFGWRIETQAGLNIRAYHSKDTRQEAQAELLERLNQMFLNMDGALCVDEGCPHHGTTHVCN